jgi:nitrilase
MTDRPFRVALVQESPVFLNLAATVERAVERIAEAAAEGAAVVVFPETWLPGYPVWIDSAPEAALWDHRPAKVLYRLLRANSPEIPGPEFDALRRAAGKAGVTVVIGLHEKRGGSLYNTILMLAADGERWKIHRKLVPTYTERLLWGQGDGSTLEALQTEHGTVGALVCWEHWMPLARAVMHAQGEILHVAQWPWVRDLHLLCSRQYAFEGQCFVAASGCSMTRGQMLAGFDSLDSGEQEARDLLESIPGDADTPMLRGGSALIAPDTEIVAGPGIDSADTVIGTVEPDRVEEGRMYLDTDGHYSRPDVFLLQVDTDPRANVMVPDPHHDHDHDHEH